MLSLAEGVASRNDFVFSEVTNSNNKVRLLCLQHVCVSKFGGLWLEEFIWDCIFVPHLPLRRGRGRACTVHPNLGQTRNKHRHCFPCQNVMDCIEPLFRHDQVQHAWSATAFAAGIAGAAGGAGAWQILRNGLCSIREKTLMMKRTIMSKNRARHCHHHHHQRHPLLLSSSTSASSSAMRPQPCKCMHE
jgi:hypothetical protein